MARGLLATLLVFAAAPATPAAEKPDARSSAPLNVGNQSSAKAGQQGEAGRAPEYWSIAVAETIMKRNPAETLSILPADYPRRPEVADIFRRLAAGLKRTHD